mmetsp:Transcript_35676/g.65432  ORF Transcript_35676/g.65432 Transcript_35676/m.65432 type:complete len:439 (-) Transcript_35676:63-1379(-)
MTRGVLCIWWALPLLFHPVHCVPNVLVGGTEGRTQRRLAEATTSTTTVPLPTKPGPGQALLYSPNAAGYKFLAWAVDVGESVEDERKVAVLTAPNGSSVNVRTHVPVRIIQRRSVAPGEALDAVTPLVLVWNGSSLSGTFQTTSSSSRSTSSTPTSTSSSRTLFTSTTTDTFTLTNVAVVGEPVVRFSVRFSTSDANGFLGDAGAQHALRSSVTQLLDLDESAVAVESTRTLEARRLTDTVEVSFEVTPPEGTSSEEIVTRVSKLDDTQKFSDTVTTELSKAGADGYDAQVMSVSSPVIDYGAPTTTAATAATTTTPPDSGSGISPMLLFLLFLLLLVLCCFVGVLLYDQHPGVDQSTPLHASTFTTDVALKGDVMIPVAFPDPFLPGAATVVYRSGGVQVETEVRIKGKLDTALALEEPLADDVAKNSEIRQRKGQE